MKPLHRIASAFILAIGALLVFSGLATGAYGTITSITPSKGPTAGGTTVTILGTDLRYGIAGPAVTIGGATAPVTSWRSYGAFGETEVIVTTPPGTAGAADVRVVTDNPSYNNMLLGEAIGGFTYQAPVPPTVTVAPTSGLTTGSEAVTITGAGFSGGTTPTVTFGGTAATGVTVVSDTSVTATTPAHAAGAVDVVVTHDGATQTGTYTYNQGYWLTVSTVQQPGVSETQRSYGGITSQKAWPAASWATSSVSQPSTLDGVTTDYSGFIGGIFCGTQMLRTIGDTSDVGTTLFTGAACKYAYAKDAAVELRAATSLVKSVLAYPAIVNTTAGYLAQWGGACPKADATTCTVKMTEDRSAKGYLGETTISNAGPVILGFSQVAPIFDLGGIATYYSVSLTLNFAAPTGTAFPYFITFAQVGSAESSLQMATRQTVSCRGRARRAGTRLVIGCKVTPALASALRRGSVRQVLHQSVRLPHQSRRILWRSAKFTLRNRHTSALTG